MEIFIKLNGKNYLFNINKNNTLNDLIILINEKFKLEKKFYYLVFNSRILSNVNKKLADFEISNYNTIDLIYRAC